MTRRIILWSTRDALPRVPGVQVERVSTWRELEEALRTPVDLVCVTAHEARDEPVTDLITRIRRHAVHPVPRVMWGTHSEEVMQVYEAVRHDALHDVYTAPLSGAMLEGWLAEPPSTQGPAPTMALRAMFTQRYRRDDFVVQSRAMQEVLDLVGRAARSQATVLITGESGTGKEKVARFVHDQSSRASRPFVAVNCKAFSPGVLESELFGHARGAFTGAMHRKQGVFERAHGGTLFLDEVGEVDVDFQGKLLRVLQEQEVLPVGAAEPLKIDVRVVAATNRDLSEEVSAGRFREDLLYRLSVIPVRVPALRERREEILVLARHFVMRHAHALGRRITGWSAEVEDLLTAHHWPGNVRELENVIERACVLSQQERIEVEDLMHHTFAPSLQGHESAPDATLQHVINEATRVHLTHVLDQTRGRRQEAAHVLGVERTTLYRLLKKFELEAL